MIITNKTQTEFYLKPTHERRLTENEIAQLNPMKLAFIGDAVYELYVRDYALSTKKGTNQAIAHFATQFSKAVFQSKAIHYIYEDLPENEQNIVKRGRNSAPKSISKKASIIDYKYATGLEALIGYLHLNGEFSRIDEIMNQIITFYHLDKNPHQTHEQQTVINRELHE